MGSGSDDTVLKYQLRMVNRRAEERIEPWSKSMMGRALQNDSTLTMKGQMNLAERQVAEFIEDDEIDVRYADLTRVEANGLFYLPTAIRNVIS